MEKKRRNIWSVSRKKKIGNSVRDFKRRKDDIR